MIQPPGEPREQHLCDVRPKKFKVHKISWKTKWPKGSIYSGANLLFMGHVTLILFVFAVFSKMRNSTSISTLPVILSFMELVFSSIVVKFKSYVISKETILIFLVNLPMVNIYKFYKEKMLIQPHGKPQEQHLGDVQPKKFELHKIS